MKNLVFVNCLLFVVGQIVYAQQNNFLKQTSSIIDTTNKIITIPRNNCQQISVDGNFDNYEWSNAIELSQPENYTIFLKADDDIFAVGLIFPKPMGELVCEIRITTDDKEVFLLHSSGGMGEGVSGFPSTTKFDLNNNKLWVSNFSTKNLEKEAEWVAAGKPLERYDEVYNKRDGIEFKISRKKIAGNTLKFTISWVRVEIKDGKPDFKQYKYPVSASLLNSDNWIKLILPN